MIQELFGGGGLGGGERKFSFHGTILEGLPSSSPSPSSYPSATTTTTTTTTTAPPENLRCPRCDSPNTKFCYYNNYNLTQPRHFCKTCRRYWTKGGALRNVPIGGGCRKNKTIVSTTAGKSTVGKGKTVTSEVLRSSLGSGFDHEQSSNPILWGSPQNSQLLSLLRATPNPNPNPNPNSSSMSNFVNVKDEGHMIGSHLSSESGAVSGSFNARSLGLDPVSQVPIGLYTSLFRNHQHQTQQQQNQYHHQNLGHGDVQNTGIQELYQRLKSSANYYPDYSSATMCNATSMPTSSSLIEPASITGGEFGGWNPQYSWSDLPTTNGAFP